MSHPLVLFLLARYDEEDPHRTDPIIQKQRRTATEMECHLITGDELDAYGVPKRDVAWGVLRLQAFRYYSHPDCDEDWLPPFASE